LAQIIQMRNLCLIFFTIITLTSQPLLAQRWLESRSQVYFGTGASGFMGDLGGADREGSQGIRDFDFKAVRPATLLGYRYFISRPIAVSGSLAFGYVYGDDFFTNEHFRQNRNLHFRSPILELSARGEYYFWELQRFGDRYRVQKGFRGMIGYNIRAYVFAGIGGFYFEPQARFEASKVDLQKFNMLPDDIPADGWYNLRQLRTEGQGYFPTREPYKPIAMVIPFGIGANITLTYRTTIGIEYGFRKTFTDYIDDVSTTYVDFRIFQNLFPDDPQKAFLAEYFSNPNKEAAHTAPGYQRGNPHNDDAYMFLFISLSYKIPDARIRGRIPGL
jgi:hypothetical protein